MSLAGSKAWNLRGGGGANCSTTAWKRSGSNEVIVETHEHTGERLPENTVLGAEAGAGVKGSPYPRQTVGGTVAASELSESWSERVSRIGIGAGDIPRAIAWTRMSCSSPGTTKSFREEGVRLALY